MTGPREYQTEAVVVKRTRLGEADRILTLYTPHLGKIQAVAKSVRKPRSKLGGHLEILSHSQVSLARGRNLDTVIGSQTINPFLPLRQSLEKISCGLYLAELVNLFTIEADRIDNLRLFELLVSSLQQLGLGADGQLCLRYFEIQLLGHAGYRPQLQTCSSCRRPLQPVTNTFSPGAGGVLCDRCAAGQSLPYPLSVNGLKVLRLFQDCSMATALRLKLPAETNLELARLLRSYCHYILEREIKSAVWLDSLPAEPR